MNEIIRMIIREKHKERKFLYFSYSANVLVICILLMIATGIKNITNESLSKTDHQQIEAILSSVIFVSILAVTFFQWVISMQFRALFDSRKQFNDNMRLMGVKNELLMHVYLRELIYMQPLSIFTGVFLAEILYYILSNILNVNSHFILIPQIIISICLHMSVITISVIITYRSRVKVNIIDELRYYDNRNSEYKMSIVKKVEAILGMVILAVSIGICIIGKSEDECSWGYFGIIIASFLLLETLLVLLHKMFMKIAKKINKRNFIFAEFIAIGYVKKNKKVCNMIIFSTMIFLGMQMLYINVRQSGLDVVDHNIHYSQTIWYEDLHEENQDKKNCYYGLKYKCDRSGSSWYINGIDDQFFDEYETIRCYDNLSKISDTLKENISSADWNGIVFPNSYLQSEDIGKEITLNILGKEIRFTIVGGVYNNNLAHISCYVSKRYLQSQLDLDRQYNMVYLKRRATEFDTSNAIIQTFEEIRKESYDKAVSGTSLVEMVSIVIIVCAILALLNYIMLSLKSTKVDIARFRGIGLSKSQINSIYIIQTIIPVIISIIIAIVLSVLFGKIGCLMVLDEGYYYGDFLITSDLMGLIFAIFAGVSVGVQLVAIRRVINSNYYISILREVKE